MEINEKTTISIFAVLCAVPFLVGGIVWLTEIDAKASASQTDMKDLKVLLLDVRERVIRLEQSIKGGVR